MPDGDGTAELVLTNLRVLPDSPEPNTLVTIYAEARNAGSVESGPFQVRYTVQKDDGGTLQSDVYWPSLYPGESHSEQWQVPTALQPGDYTYSVILDYYSQVTEQNKDDNGLQNYFQIGAPPTPMALPDEKDETLSGKSVNVGKEEEETISGGTMVHTNIGAGNTVQAEIMSQVHDLNQAIGKYWTNYATALSDFESSMAFPPDQEVEKDYLKSVLTKLFDTVLNTGLAALSAELGEAGGKLVEVAKTLVETALESDAPGGGGKAKIADYIQNLRDSIVSQEQQMQSAVDYHSLLAEYMRLSDDLPDKGAASPEGNILGPGAQLILNLRAGVSRLRDSTPSIGEFQQRLTEAFAGMPVKEGGHYRVDGRLYIHLNLHNDGSKWEINKGQSDERWTLLTSQPDPEGAAHSLYRSIVVDQHKMPWNSELPKEVDMFIEVEESGNNTYADGRLVFASDNTEPNDVFTVYSKDLFIKAWEQSAIKSQVMNASDIIGKSL